MPRTFAFFAALVASAIFALLSWFSMNPVGALATQTNTTPTPILSPRRVPALTAAMPADAALRATVSNALNATGNTQTCVSVVRDGRVVVADNSEQPLIPASTMKILTATAALNSYKSDDTFSTLVTAKEPVNAGQINGPLYLVGGGDPLLFTSDYARNYGYKDGSYTSLEKLADQVVASGVKSVHGSVVGDDSRFDQTRYLPTWEQAYKNQGQVGPISGLMVNQGFAKFNGGRVGADNPTFDAAETFTNLLRARGVTVDQAPATGIAPPKTTGIASIQSPSVKDITAEMLRESDNTTAEMLLKNIGFKARGQGSFEVGAAASTAAAAEAGVPMAGVVIVDGSGLDRANRVTCQAIVTALSKNGNGGVIRAGLPRAGETGTLADRMKGTVAVGRVQAKTGTLAGVNALAGWAAPTGGGAMAFVVINNGMQNDPAREFEDGLAETFAGLPAQSSVVAYAPSN